MKNRFLINILFSILIVNVSLGQNPKIKNLLPPLDIGYSGDIIARAFNKLGWHWWPSYAAIKKSKKFKKGIRPTAVEIYLNKAIKNGVIVKPNSRVLKIKLSKNKIATGVIYSNSKKERKFFLVMLDHIFWVV